MPPDFFPFWATLDIIMGSYITDLDFIFIYVDAPFYFTDCLQVQCHVRGEVALFLLPPQALKVETYY